MPIRVGRKVRNTPVRSYKNNSAPSTCSAVYGLSRLNKRAQEPEAVNFVEYSDLKSKNCI
jgi:hypothetical protein